MAHPEEAETVRFDSIGNGTKFRCDMGGLWSKIDPIMAKCQETDSAYKQGDIEYFHPHEQVEVVKE